MKDEPVSKFNQAEQSSSTSGAKSDSTTRESVPLFRQLQRTIGNRALGRRIQAKLEISQPDDVHEQEADRVADQVMRTAIAPAEASSAFIQRNRASEQQPSEESEGEVGIVQPKTISAVTGRPPSTEGDLTSIRGGGQPLTPAALDFFEPRLGCDFSGVRVHADAGASHSAQDFNARAYTVGRDVIFGAGNYAPETTDGKRLLAHELVHVAQQRGDPNRAVIQRKISDAELETEFQKWAADKKEKIDKNSVDYAHQLWTFIYEIVADPQTATPKVKPQKPAELKKWQEGFEKAELVADWLIRIKKTTNSDSLKNAAESRLSGILDLMRQADLLLPAMTRANDLESGNKKSLFEAILNSPQSATVNDIERIVSFFCSSAKDPADCTVIQILTSGNDHPIKSSLSVAHSKGMVKILVNNYLNSPKLIDALAELLMFNPKIRNDISGALMKSELGGSPELLFKVLKHPFFTEPGYGDSLLATLKGSTTTDDYEKKRIKDDMPWVYTFKQKYYVDFLIEMAKKQSIVIPKPAKMAFPELKTWLDTNTENIGKAAKATYTTQEEVFEMYRNIADIFFFHVPHDRNVNPELSGKIGHLQPGMPSKMRFEADCDVFATYAMRLLSSAGFEGIGYLGIYPKGAFKNRAAHVVALIRKNNRYSLITNKDIFDLSITETKPDEKRAEAIAKLKARGLKEGYEDPLPTDADIFYGDAEANGKMSSKFFSSDAGLERKDLE